MEQELSSGKRKKDAPFVFRFSRSNRPRPSINGTGARQSRWSAGLVSLEISYGSRTASRHALSWLGACRYPEGNCSPTCAGYDREPPPLLLPTESGLGGNGSVLSRGRESSVGMGFASSGSWVMAMPFVCLRSSALASSPTASIRPAWLAGVPVEVAKSSSNSSP